MSRRAPRPYRSGLRQQQADATRLRVVASATKLFSADGYARTTMARIAQDAGVSAETVQLHGPKSALMRAAVEYSAFGTTHQQNILDTEEGRALLDIDDFAEAVEYLATTQLNVHRRTARIGSALIGAATADPELDRYLTELTGGVNLQVRRILEALRDRGWVRDDIPFEELAETAAVLSSFEVYTRMTVRDGVTDDQYRAWLRRMMLTNVLR
jgi:AcrR family transcriptional regulator